MICNCETTCLTGISFKREREEKLWHVFFSSPAMFLLGLKDFENIVKGRYFKLVLKWHLICGLQSRYFEIVTPFALQKKPLHWSASASIGPTNTLLVFWRKLISEEDRDFEKNDLFSLITFWLLYITLLTSDLFLSVYISFNLQSYSWKSPCERTLTPWFDCLMVQLHLSDTKSCHCLIWDW